MDEQLEKLKIIYENSRSHYEEATFRRPARVIDRGFRWSAIYAIALAIVPQYLQVSLESLIKNIHVRNMGIVIPELVLVIISILAFFFAISELIQTIRYRKYDWVDLEELPRISGAMSLSEFYATLTERFLVASSKNLRIAQSAAKRLSNSNRWFYRALFFGIVEYLFSKLEGNF